MMAIAGRASLISGWLLTLPLVAQLSEISSIRHWSLEGATRVAVQASAETEFHVELLQNPDRLFVDLRDSNLRIGGRPSTRIDVNDQLVTQIRAAQTQATVSRIVLDLKVPVDYEISHLANPHRLMIEVRAKSASRTTLSTNPPSPAVVLASPAPIAAKTSTEATRSTVPAVPPVAPSTPGPITPVLPAPKPARRNADGTRSLTRALGLKLSRVVLDPGHGGKDEGTSCRGGLREKDLVLDVALRLGALLEERLGTEVVYTRRDDTFIPLETRTAIANREKADLFLSIHANSSATSTAGGIETYYLNFATSQAEQEIAGRENAGTTLSIHELQDLVRKIAMRDKMDESREFAGQVQTALHARWAKSGGTARNRGVKKAPFVVLIGAAMPSVLTEIGFMSNAREEKLMNTPAYRQQLAEALYRGISQYVASLSHFDLAQTN